MLAATAIAPLFIPLFFCLFDGWKNKGAVVAPDNENDANKEVNL